MSATAHALTLPASLSSTRDRLLLLNLFRVLVATVLLAATFLFGGQRAGALPLWNTQHLLYHATGTMIVMTLLFSYAIERVEESWALNALGMSQFVFDTAFASVLVLVTGGLDSVFTFFYSLFIINASIVLYWTGALVAALASTVMLLCVALVQYGVLPLGPAQPFVEQIFPELDAGLSNWSQLVLNFATNIVAFYAVAFLSSFLAGVFTAVGGERFECVPLTTEGTIRFVLTGPEGANEIQSWVDDGAEVSDVVGRMHKGDHLPATLGGR